MCPHAWGTRIECKLQFKYIFSFANWIQNFFDTTLQKMVIIANDVMELSKNL